MMKKTNILVVSLVTMMSAGVARADTATTAYVDGKDNALYSRMQTQDSRIATIRDWVNPKQNGSFATLDTNAKNAYGAINELNSGVQSLGTNLVTVRNWVNHKENGEFVTLDTTAQDAYGAINELNTAVSAKANTADLAAVATSGSYNDLTDKPAAQDLSGYATTAAMNTALADKANTADLAAVATSGSYNDLTDKPAAQDLSGYATTAAMDTALADKADASDLEALEGLVATSGQTIPSTIGSTNNVTTIVGAINALNTKTNSMPTDAGFTELTTRVETAEDDIDALEEDIDALEAQVGTDAMGTTATTVTGAIAELGNEIGSKQDVLVASGNGQNIQGTGSVTVTKDANGMITVNGTDTTYSTGTASTEGLTKLYTGVGENTDGTMTQAAIKTALDTKANSADLAAVATSGSYNDLTDKPAAQDLSGYATTASMNTALGTKVDKGTVPSSGQYILGFIDGAQAYIPVVDADGNSGNIVYLNE